MGVLTTAIENRLTAMLEGWLSGVMQEKQIRQRVKELLDHRQDAFTEGRLAGNIDFEGMRNYLLDGMWRQADNHLLAFLYGEKKEREKAEAFLCAAACEYAGAKDPEARDEVARTTKWVLGIVSNYIRENTEKDVFMAKAIECLEQITEQLDKVRENPESMGEKGDHGKEMPGIPKPGKRLSRPYKQPRGTEYYVGTENCQRLRSRMDRQKRILVLGMPGIGKTEGVLRCLKERDDVSGVWLDCRDWEHALESVYVFLKRENRISAQQKAEISDLRNLLDLLCWHLREYENVVLVLDNVNGVEILREVAGCMEFPCPMIAISCLNSEFGCFRKEEVLYWEELGMEESMQLLEELSGGRVPEKSEMLSEALAKLCGGLPMAVCQAAAYIQATQITMEEYAQQCSQAAELLFLRREPSSREFWEKGVNIQATFWLPYQTLRKGEEGEKVLLPLLQALLYFDPSGMAEGLLKEASGLSASDFNLGLGKLLQFSLIRRKDGKIYIKQVVQDILRSFLTPVEKGLAMARNGQVLADSFSCLAPVETVIEAYTVIGGSAQRFQKILEKEGQPVERLAEIRLGLGEYYYLQGFYKLGQEEMVQALELAACRKDFWLGCKICSELGELEEIRGDDLSAMQYVEPLCQWKGKLLEHAPRTVVQGLLVEAHVYENQRENERALEKADQVLEVLKEYDTRYNWCYYLIAGICKINVLNQMEKYEEAEQMYEGLLQELEVSREDHPEDLLVMDLHASAANTRLHQGELEAAREFYRSHLAFYKEKYQNEKHPQLAYVCTNLAVTYMEKADYSKAEEWLEQAEDIVRESAPEHHELKLQIWMNRLVAAFRLGKYEPCCRYAEHILAENCFTFDPVRRTEIDANVWIIMAYVQYGLRQWEQAKSCLETADGLEKQLGKKETLAQMHMKLHLLYIERVEKGEKMENII